jgi:4-alpha-glucanotransferase
MEQDDYAWWRSRMQHLERYFSAIRIDHILGFFRIWELPASARTGRMGRFRPSLPITRDELLGRGRWDINRLTEPYIQWLEIEATFGDKAQEVAFRYMQECDEQRGLWQFRREFETEQAIFDATAPRQDLPEHFAEEQLNVRAGLMRFFQNRCLIVDPENIDHFYPMFGLEETSSYDALEPWTRDAPRDMSHDYYFGRQSSTWRKQARKVLPALLRSNEMLVCGEDLGFTPTCVPPVMAELGILGLRIQRMPPVGESAEFGRPSTYNYLTVCSPSCHDTMTTRAWWEEDAERRERYDEMFGSGVDDSCTPSVMRNIITQHVESPSVLAIFPIQDLLALDAEYSKRPALDETINDPTNPKHYWRFRLHVTCEDMLANSTFIKDVKDVLHERSNIV